MYYLKYLGSVEQWSEGTERNKVKLLKILVIKIM